MHIQDAVHGYIVLNELEEDVVDTPTMQRLRHIKQLGFTQLVYPSATHTRFEHSLGACHLAGQFADALEMDAADAQALRLAALFHDLGHGPFSHATDYIFHEHEMSHESFSIQKITDSEIADILEDDGVDPEQVADLVAGNGVFGSIIAGHIDVDRMDYLMRDAHYSGVAYGTIDAATILRAARLHDDQLVFDAKYRNALEGLLSARYLMFPTVYVHRTVQIAKTMLQHGFRQLHRAGEISVEELPEMDDHDFRNRMQQSDVDTARRMMNRITDRDLYKVAYRSSTVEQDLDAAKEELLDRTGLADHEILVDIVDLEDTSASDVPLIQDGEIIRLADLSPLPRTLTDALNAQQEFRVYTDRRHVDAAGDAAENILD